MNEMSVIFDIFCIFLLSVVLNFKSIYILQRQKSTFIKEPNVPKPVQLQPIIAALESPQTAVLLHVN